jgi:hypothetical protein
MNGCLRGMLLVFFCVVLFVFAFPYWPELEYFFLPARLKQVLPHPTWACGDSGCAAILTSAYQVPVSHEEQQNGIEERWCLRYTRVRSHTGKMAWYFRWAYQTGIRAFQVVEKQKGRYTWADAGEYNRQDERYQIYCSSIL